MSTRIEDSQQKLSDKLDGSKIRSSLYSVFSTADAATRSSGVRTKSSKIEEVKEIVPIPSFDQVSKESDGIFDSNKNFLGFRFYVNRNIAQGFNITQTVHIGTSFEQDKPRKCYSLKATLGGPNSYISGMLDTNLSHTAKVFKKFDNGVSINVTSSSVNEGTPKDSSKASIQLRYEDDDLKCGIEATTNQRKFGTETDITVDAARRIVEGLSVGLKGVYALNNKFLMSGILRYENTLSSQKGLESLAGRRYRIKRKMEEYKRDGKQISPEFLPFLDDYTFEPTNVLTLIANADSLKLTQTYNLSRKFAISAALDIFKKYNLPTTSSWKVGYKFYSNETEVTGTVANITDMRSLIKTKFNEFVGVSVSGHVDLSRDVYEFGFGVDITA